MCGNGETCIKYPEGCQSSADCYWLISYKYNKQAQIFDLMLATNETWVGFAQVPNRPHDMVSFTTSNIL